VDSPKHRYYLSAKTLLQDLCGKNLGWDDPISDEDLSRWRNWLEKLPRLEDLFKGPFKQRLTFVCFKPIREF